MAPRQNSNNSANDFDVSIEEIVFSCGICQATVSELYADKDKIHALSSDGDDSGIIPKLWIADCSHIFCGRHLEGGGAPFHSKHEAPMAQCPVCVSERKRGHQEKRGLYAIRGLKQGEYDEAVPESYLHVPPIRLDSSDPSMDAMRFQYSHLVHYAKQITKSWKIAEKKRKAMEHTLSKERKQWRTQEAELNKRVATLEQTEVRLNKWEQRKAKIDHYLNLVTKMSDVIRNMRGQLLELGYQVPDVEYAFEEDQNTQPKAQKRAPRVSKQKNSSATLAASSSARKRKHPFTHGDYADETIGDKENNVHIQRRESHELMPPPLPRGRPPQPSPTHAQPASSRVGSEAPMQGFRDDYATHTARPQASQPNRANLLSLPPRRRSDIQQQIQDGTGRFPPPGSHAGSISHSKNAYAAINATSQQYAQQAYHTSRAPSVPQSRAMAPPNKVLSTPSLRRPLEPVAGPGASPFFANRAPLQVSGTTQRHAPRGFAVQQSQAPPTRDGTMGRPIDSMPRAPVQRSHQSRAMPPPPSMFRPQSHVRSSLPQIQYRQVRPSYREGSSSQVGPMSEGVHQRNGMIAHQQPRQSGSQLHTGRLTMPPSRSQPTHVGSQDSRLSMIPGARGAAPLQSMSSNQAWGNAQGSSRYGSSFGGVRRPVQR